MLRLNRRHVYCDNVAPSSGMSSRHRYTCARERHPISITAIIIGIEINICIVYVCATIFKNSVLLGDTVPLKGKLTSYNVICT